MSCIKQENQVEETSVSALVVDIAWCDRLKRWFECFNSFRLDWGLVDCRHDDCSTYKRHGVVVTLSVDLTDMLLATEGANDRFLKLREAIDLVQLVLAVDPTAIHPHVQENEASEDAPDYAEHIQAMRRGVPVALRLQLEFHGATTRVLKDRLSLQLIKPLDWKLSTDSDFVAARRGLMRRLAQDESQRKQVLHRVARAVLVVDLTQEDDLDGLATEDFFEDLRAFAADLASYQSERSALMGEWTMATRFAQFTVEKIDLRLQRLRITSRVVGAANNFVKAGIPVDCSHLNLDFSVIYCTEHDLQIFVQAMTEKSSGVEIRTSGKTDCVDAAGQDRRALIRMTLRAIASIGDRVSEVDLGGMLKLCGTASNREAIWQGLFEDILSRDSRLEALSFRGSAQLLNEDVPLIQQCTAKWRLDHPSNQLRVKTLEMLLTDAEVAAIHALVSAFDDVKTVMIFPEESEQRNAQDVLGKVLAYPSLRSLHVSNATIETMDIFDPSVLDARIPVKAVLEDLVLEGIKLQDQTSLLRFLRQLKHSNLPSALAKTLQRLHVLQSDEDLNQVPIFDSATLAVLDDMLKSNKVLSDVGISVDVHDPAAHTRRRRLLQHKGILLPSPQHRTSSPVKARNVAFLSVIRGGAASSRIKLDAGLLHRIFDFSAPHTVRRMDVQWLNI